MINYKFLKLTAYTFLFFIFYFLCASQVSACVTSYDCPAGQTCIQGQCFIPGCHDDSVCDPSEYCDVPNKQCKPGCRTSADCATGNICITHQCVPGCNNDSDCATGKKCDTTVHLCIDGCYGKDFTGTHPDFDYWNYPSQIMYGSNGKINTMTSLCSGDGSKNFAVWCDGNKPVVSGDFPVDYKTLAGNWGRISCKATGRVCAWLSGSGACVQAGCDNTSSYPYGFAETLVTGITQFGGIGVSAPSGAKFIDPHSLDLIDPKLPSHCVNGLYYPARCSISSDGNGKVAENDLPAGTCPPTQ